MKLTDYDSATKVSEQTYVVRWGKVWRVWAIDDLGDGAVTGPPFPTKLAAAAYALRKVERGDYR